MIMTMMTIIMTEDYDGEYGKDENGMKVKKLMMAKMMIIEGVPHWPSHDL